MRLYIATKFENIEEFNNVKYILEDAGHVITFDWTQHRIDESHLTKQEKAAFYRACAMEDYFGVASCDAIVLLAYPNLAGAFVELGIAIALNKKIIVVNYEKGPHNIFYNLPNVQHVKNIDGALARLQDDNIGGLVQKPESLAATY